LKETRSAVTETRVPLRDLLHIPEYVVMLVGGWFATFAAYAYITRGTQFVSRYKGYGLAKPASASERW
jgi:hypothetical protein